MKKGDPLKRANPNPLPSGIRLVAVDLDGTLLNSRKELPESTAEIFKEAKRAGLFISIVTGRNACTVRALGKILSFTGPHASSGGALVSGNSGRPVYIRHCLRQADVRLIVEICRRWELTIFIQNDTKILMENGERFLREVSRPYYPCVPRPCKDILAEISFRPLKATIYGDHRAIVSAREDFARFDGRLHVTTAGEEDIEVTGFGVNKGSALREISNVSGIPLNNIMAIGDSQNDLSMFSMAGIPVAVANAAVEVKQAARVIAPSNDEAGALWAIKNLALAPEPIC